MLGAGLERATANDRIAAVVKEQRGEQQYRIESPKQNCVYIRRFGFEYGVLANLYSVALWRSRTEKNLQALIFCEKS